MNIKIFCAVCSKICGDEWDLGFFDNEKDALHCIAVDKKYSSFDYTYAVRVLDVDLISGESLREAYYRHLEDVDAFTDPYL